MSDKSKSEIFDQDQAELHRVVKAMQRTYFEQLEVDRQSAGAFPGGTELLVGDSIEHPSHGRCAVACITSETVSLILPGGKQVELNAATVSFRPLAIEAGGQRVFEMS